MATIEIPEDEIKDLLSAQILSQISQESRDKMITAAMNTLLTSRDSYSRKTPVQEAFDQAVRRVANGVADEVIAEAGVEEKLATVMRGLIAEMSEIEYDFEIQSALFSILIAHIRKDRG